MIKKLTLSTLCFIMAIWFAIGCSMQPVRPKPKAIIIPGGTLAPALGVGFDVNYDMNLDEVVPGYKIMTVAYTNNSMNIIQLDPIKDNWHIENRRGKKVRAIINLRNKDPDVWSGLPKRLKLLIEYPLLIPIGRTQTIDLLFKNNSNLNEFRAVVFKPGSSVQAFRILPREE